MTPEVEVQVARVRADAVAVGDVVVGERGTTVVESIEHLIFVVVWKTPAWGAVMRFRDELVEVVQCS